MWDMRIILTTGHVRIKNWSFSTVWGNFVLVYPLPEVVHFVLMWTDGTSCQQKLNVKKFAFGPWAGFSFGVLRSFLCSRFRASSVVAAPRRPGPDAAAAIGSVSVSMWIKTFLWRGSILWRSGTGPWLMKKTGSSRLWMFSAENTRRSQGVKKHFL